VARKVLAEQGVQASQLQAVGIANQRETTVLWDRLTGQPVAPAIVWQDRRTADYCEQLRAEGKAKLICECTGLELDAYFSATKLKWLLDHVPGARQRAERGELCFGTVDSWLAFKLCGVHVTDVSNASRTMLFNIHLMRWDADLLALFGIPPSLLPQVVSSSEEAGTTHEELFGAPVPLAGIAGDQQAATFGQACHQPGMVKNTYGTGCFMLMHAGAHPRVSHNRLLSTVGWRVDGSTDAMAWALSSSPRRWKRWRPVCRTAAACCWCRPSSAWARRTGIPMRAAPSWASRVAAPKRISRVPPSNPSPTRAPSCWPPCSATPRFLWPRCGPTAGRRATIC
jgi:glycerol kinase